jgi:23S rRNA (cytosine1962-C5)-methyltransferase
MTSYPQIFLNTKRAKTFDGRHPWVMARSVIEPTVPLQSGQIVELFHPSGSWIGRGIYNAESRIRVRLYQWEPQQTLDEIWLRQRLEQAVGMREFWMAQNQPLDAIRLVNSEGDGLSGLIVDQFKDYLMVQITALAMLDWLQDIVAWLTERIAPSGIYVNVDPQVAKQEGIEALSEWIVGSPPADPIELVENGIRLQLDLPSGQKTGYYLDQRANRIAAAGWMQPGSLLDVCCYHAGFSLAGCRTGKLHEVTAIDSSERALAVAQRNAERNAFSQMQFDSVDCFDSLAQWVAEGRKFDNIVLDPPRMAGARQKVASALRAYHRLNFSAIQLLRAGGTLVTCSCSGRVSRQEFWGVLASAAKRSRRRLQVVETRSADFDHPVDINCPESDYLKCFICRVE